MMMGVGGADRRSEMSFAEIDRSLLDRCLRGKPRAWEDFVGRFAGLILCTVDHVANSRGLPLASADRDDLVAEVFLEFLNDNMRALRSFRGKSSLATYLAIIARRTVLRRLVTQRDRIRPVARESSGGGNRNRGNDPKSKGADDVEPDPSVIPDRTDFLRRYEDREAVEFLLGRLSNDEAMAVRLYYLESFSYRDIAERLRMSENSIGSLLSRALGRMREMAGDVLA